MKLPLFKLYQKLNDYENGQLLTPENLAKIIQTNDERCKKINYTLSNLTITEYDRQLSHTLKQQLPCYVGTLTGSDFSLSSSELDYRGLIMLDFDCYFRKEIALDYLNQIIDKYYEYIVLAHLSSSHKGLRIWFQHDLNLNQHIGVWRYICEEIKEFIDNKQFDFCCQHPLWISWLPHSEEVYYNNNPKPFNIKYDIATSILSNKAIDNETDLEYINDIKELENFKDMKNDIKLHKLLKFELKNN